MRTTIQTLLVVILMGTALLLVGWAAYMGWSASTVALKAGVPYPVALLFAALASSGWVVGLGRAWLWLLERAAGVW